MDDKKNRRDQAGPAPTDAEIASEAERLGANWAAAAARPRAAGAGHILQNLAHGRSHVVTVEVKRTPRQRGPR
jgi:hypothetical protein